MTEIPARRPILAKQAYAPGQTLSCARQWTNAMTRAHAIRALAFARILRVKMVRPAMTEIPARKAMLANKVIAREVIPLRARRRTIATSPARVIPRRAHARIP